MSKLSALEAIPTGSRSGAIRPPDRLRNVTLGIVFCSRPVPGPEPGEGAGRLDVGGRKPLGWQVLALAILLVIVAPAEAATVLGPWLPLFEGIDHTVGTNTPDGSGMPDLMVMNALRIDLTSPNIQLYASPRIATNYSADFEETAGSTTTNFLKNHGLKVAINANAFAIPGTGDPGIISGLEPEGTPFDVMGLEICQGQVVSPQVSSNSTASFMFTPNNEVTFVPTNWPAQSTEGVYTAVTGFYAILVNQVNVGLDYIGSSDSLHFVNPRTAFGLSQDRRYLYLIVIDGGQPGYSEGALDWETAAWLMLLGASDGANMDGGGSSCMVIEGSDGVPVPLNQDCASLENGVERADGSHFGVFANSAASLIHLQRAGPRPGGLAGDRLR
jgi:hypothetical protein